MFRRDFLKYASYLTGGLTSGFLAKFPNSKNKQEINDKFFCEYCGAEFIYHNIDMPNGNENWGWCPNLCTKSIDDELRMSSVNVSPIRLTQIFGGGYLPGEHKTKRDREIKRINN